MSGFHLHDMELHDREVITSYILTRVPGGWIYEKRGSNEAPMIFVPYSKEFNTRKKETPARTSYDVEAAKELLSFLNERAGKSFLAVEANLDLIGSRLKEGYEYVTLRQMISLKCRQWRNDPDMAKYLRPATLFNKTKCAQYAGELQHEV